jgi:excisionase family DNA binding protein
MQDLKVLEAAEALRIHPETVRVWIREGRFPHAYQLGRRGGWRIPPDDLVALKVSAVVSEKYDSVALPDDKPIRRLPRTVGQVADESFQASESEVYMHEHRGHAHAQ